MSKIRLYEGLVRNLEGKVDERNRKLFLTKEDALKMLKEKTGQDFGFEVKEWREWLKKNGYR